MAAEDSAIQTVIAIITKYSVCKAVSIVTPAISSIDTNVETGPIKPAWAAGIRSE